MQSLLIMLSWIFFGILCSKIAKKKNRNISSWFFLGIFFGLFAVIIIYFLKPLQSTNQNIIIPNQTDNYLSILKNDTNYWYYLDINKKQIICLGFALQI